MLGIISEKKYFRIKEILTEVNKELIIATKGLVGNLFDNKSLIRTVKT